MSEVPKRKMTLERTYAATPEEVWELWTTKQGIESWWGPDGFTVAVRRLDLRPGGSLSYVMTATSQEVKEFMTRAGMPQSTEALLTFTDVTPPRRLAYEMLADFIPGVAPYSVATLVELQASGRGTRLVLTFDAMHDAAWTEQAVLGRKSELERLARVLEA
jgi:uncharacterized protein YndB with AHSA1/START domain